MLYLELFAILALTLINGLLAMSELAIVSSRKSRLDHLSHEGNRGAHAALQLIDDPSRFLSTVQIGITLVGVVAGAFSGATLGARLGAWLNDFDWIAPYGNPVGTAITVVAITYLSLIVGELVPKRIALAQPERIASRIARPMRMLSMVAAPAVWLLQRSTETVLKFLRISGTRETSVTEDEVKALIAEGTQAGVFVPQEQEMIEGVLRLADRSVRVIMTPRTKIVWVDAQADGKTVLDLVQSHRFSRLLVCEGTVDHPVGLMHTKDLLPGALCWNAGMLSQCMTPLLYVPDRSTVLNLLNRFKKEQAHLAVVVNEYGALEGLVTLTDVMEAIAGDIPEQGEAPGPQIVQRDDGSWLVDGAIPTDEVEAATGIDMGEEIEMLAGFILNHLGRIPTAGMGFIYENARFEVIDMDGNRIDKVLIQIDVQKDDDPSSE